MDNSEYDVLVQAWLQRKTMPAPILVRKKDNRLEPLGRHDLAICEAAKRLGAETISGVYILNCEDEAKLQDLADEMDKLHEQILKDTKAEICDGQHRLIEVLNRINKKG